MLSYCSAIPTLAALAELTSASPFLGDQDLSTVLSTSPEQLATYSLIIAVNVEPTHLLPLSDIAWNNQIPFLKVRTVGFYGYLRVQVNEIASEFEVFFTPVAVAILAIADFPLSSRRDPPRIAHRPPRPLPFPRSHRIRQQV